MEDKNIIELYWRRDERAVFETQLKYGRLCQYIAGNIICSAQDCEEILNDTWLGVWNAVPPQHPACLKTFVAKIARNLALKKYAYNTADKRSTNVVSALDELQDCVCGMEMAESELEKRRIEQLISAFLRSKSEIKRSVFVRRYWYFDSIESICDQTGFSRAKLRSMLFRLRKELREDLEKEGVQI